ncbi:hypothetical protein ACRDU6_00445 (plasmid) [Mycolicibacterium sp. ELW1]|uniref:hypothetical protein n=1 Tax=Mycobacteriaceae TaxID=1762 RepID=UPI0011ED2A2A|nr:hypothetical protein [Mycobacterium sp. ELW1]QEN17626.1 hypothetical protein D3H54_30645 [Mycobacterium sp. ELW1]
MDTTTAPALTTTVYLNDAEASFLGFNRAAPARLRAAATFNLAIPTGTRPHQTAIGAALEHIFDELNCEPTASWAVGWRHAGHRSLSVGDVVVIGETAWAVASVGWNPVSADELAAAINRG